MIAPLSNIVESVFFRFDKKKAEVIVEFVNYKQFRFEIDILDPLFYLLFSNSVSYSEYYETGVSPTITYNSRYMINSKVLDYIFYYTNRFVKRSKR